MIKGRTMLRRFAATALTIALLIPTTARAEEPRDDTKKKKTAAERAAALMDRVGRHVVWIKLRFQKDLEAEATGVEPPDARSTSESWRAYRMSYPVPGFLIRDRRTVIASDVWIPPGSIASVELWRPGSKPLKGRLRGFLRRAEAVIFEAEADLDGEPVPFPDRVEARPTTTLYAGSITEGHGGGLETWFSSLGSTRRRPWGSSVIGHGQPAMPSVGLTGRNDGVRTVDLVMDRDGKPHGFRFGAAIDPEHGTWTGPAVLADEEIPFETLKTRAQQLAQTSPAHRVKVTFRIQSRDERRRNPFYMGDESRREAEFWGLAIKPDLLVVVGRLEPDLIRKIENVRVADDDGPGVAATFAGRVRGYDAFLVRLKEGQCCPRQRRPCRAAARCCSCTASPGAVAHDGTRSTTTGCQAPVDRTGTACSWPPSGASRAARS